MVMWVGSLVLNKVHIVAKDDSKSAYGIQRCLIGVGLITEVKQRRARLIIGWVTARDCQVPYTLGHRAAKSCRGAQRTT